MPQEQCGNGKPHSRENQRDGAIGCNSKQDCCINYFYFLAHETDLQQNKCCNKIEQVLFYCKSGFMCNIAEIYFIAEYILFYCSRNHTNTLKLVKCMGSHYTRVPIEYKPACCKQVGFAKADKRLSFASRQLYRIH